MKADKNLNNKAVYKDTKLFYKYLILDLTGKSNKLFECFKGG